MEPILFHIGFSEAWVSVRSDTGLRLGFVLGLGSRLGFEAGTNQIDPLT